MKKIDYIIAGSFVALSSFFVFSAWATIESHFIKKLDLDLDGHISVKEAIAAPKLLERFGTLDLDGNGKLSPRELSQTKLNIIDNHSTK